MIRALGMVLGLALGLGLAVAVYGRMSHLRAVAGWLGPLPGWTLAVASDAGPLAGLARGPAGALLVWRLDGIDTAGPRWALRTEGAGLSLALTARLAPGPVLALTDASGEAVLTGPRLTGHFVLTGGGGRLDAQGLSLDLTAQGRRLSLEGAALPDGPVRLTLSPGGDWRLDLGTQQLAGAELATLLGD